MANKEQVEALIQETKKNLTEIEKYKVDELIRERELGESLCFLPIKQNLENTLSLFAKVNKDNLDDISYIMIRDFNSQLQSFINTVKLIKDFSTTVGQPVNRRQGIITEIQNKYDEYLKYTMPVISYQKLLTDDSNESEEKVNKIIAEIKQKRDEEKKKSDEYIRNIEIELNNAKEAAKSAKIAASQTGVSKHSTLFNDEAKAYEKKSKAWFKAIIGVIFIIITATVIFILLFPSDAEKVGEIIQYTIAKAVILSTLFYGLSLCNRNYKAARHNAIINKHRQNALGTFETFTNAAGGDEQTKNAVLLAATKTIFSNQQTGYNDTNETDNSNKIVEIIKNVATKGDN